VRLLWWAVVGLLFTNRTLLSHTLPYTHTQAKVCDFNLSRMATSAAVNNSGDPNSPAWQSPEILGGECYSTATDVFSFAVVM
jgi:serine/threonine protein kinase